MADTNSSRVVYQSDRFVILELCGTGDGTGQTDAIVANIAQYTMSRPTQAVQYFSVEEIKATVAGYTKVDLNWGASPNVLLATLPTGMTNRKFSSFDGYVNPLSNGYTGNILLTVANTPANGTYNIVLKLKKKRAF